MSVSCQRVWGVGMGVTPFIMSPVRGFHGVAGELETCPLRLRDMEELCLMMRKLMMVTGCRLPWWIPLVIPTLVGSRGACLFPMEHGSFPKEIKRHTEIESKVRHVAILGATHKTVKKLNSKELRFIMRFLGFTTWNRVHHSGSRQQHKWSLVIETPENKESTYKRRSEPYLYARHRVQSQPWSVLVHEAFHFLFLCHSLTWSENTWQAQGQWGGGKRQ